MLGKLFRGKRPKTFVGFVREQNCVQESRLSKENELEVFEESELVRGGFLPSSGDNDGALNAVGAAGTNIFVLSGQRGYTSPGLRAEESFSNAFLLRKKSNRKEEVRADRVLLLFRFQ